MELRARLSTRVWSYSPSAPAGVLGARLPIGYAGSGLLRPSVIMPESYLGALLSPAAFSVWRPGQPTPFSCATSLFIR